MARTSMNTNVSKTQPEWAGDGRGAESVMPGGVILDAAAFAALAGAPYTVNGETRVPSGVAVGRTIAERDANSPMGPAAATDDEVRVLAFATEPLERNPDGTLYRPGRIVYENYLPEVLAGTLDAGVLAKLRTTYVCSLATD